MEATNSIINGSSVSAAVITANTEVSPQDLRDALDLAGYGWAVQTRYLGPTNTKGGRISAGFAGGHGRTGKKILGYDHTSASMENHLRAAIAFLNSLDNGSQEYKLCAVFSTSNGYLFFFR